VTDGGEGASASGAAHAHDFFEEVHGRARHARVRPGHGEVNSPVSARLAGRWCGRFRALLRGGMPVRALVKWRDG
jgi:hypothetical protein